MSGQKHLVTGKFSQFSHNGLADLVIYLRYAWSSKSRSVSSSKVRTGLINVKNQLSFWSLNDLLSLLFISGQAQARGNYTE